MLEKEQMMNIFGKVEIETIIKKIEGKTLKQTERNYLYRSIRPKLIAANLLCQERLLEKINKDNKEDDSLIEYNLSLYGYEMISTKTKRQKKIFIENLIAEILIKHPKARFIEAIPMLFLKNRIDKFRLLEIASKYNLKNKIGYLLETAFLIKKLPYLKDLLNYLAENKDEEISYLVEGDEEFLRKTSPARVLRWNLLGRFFDEDFMKQAKVYL
jgi:hypothetical protein